MNPTMMTAWRAAVRRVQILACSVNMVVDFRVGGSFFGGRRGCLLAQRLAFERQTMATVHWFKGQYGFNATHYRRGGGACFGV
jgi:hypothetical protein